MFAPLELFLKKLDVIGFCVCSHELVGVVTASTYPTATDTNMCVILLFYTSTLCNFKKIQCSYYLDDNLVKVIEALDFLEIA